MNANGGETQNGNAASWLTTGPFATLLAGLLFVMFPGVVLGWKTFFHHDYTVFGYPLACFHRESFWRGEIPFWNPLNNCGLPFLAQWNTLTLYPGSLIYLLLPLPWSLNLYCLLHLVLAGVGAYLLAFRWTENRLAAGIAGLSFALNGLSQCCLIWPNNVAAVAWAPWLILAVQRAVQFGGRTIVPAALVGAIQMLSGAPEIILFTWCIAAAMVFADVIGSRSEIVRKVLRFAAVATLVALIAAVQLLPFAELLRSSQRDTSYGDAMYSMPASGWANLLIPLFRMYESRYGVFFQPMQNWTTSYYVGIATILFAACAWRSSNKIRTIVLMFLALTGLLFAAGDNGWVYPFIRKTVPVLGFMNFPIKFIVLTVFSLPLLAAIGVSSMSAAAPEMVRRTFIGVGMFLGVLVGGILVFAYMAPIPGLRSDVALLSGISRLAFLLAIIAALYASFRATARSRALLPAATLLLVAADCLTLAPNQTPTIESSYLAPGLLHPEFDLKPQVGVGRAWIDSTTYENISKSRLSSAKDHIVGLRIMLHMNCNLLDDVAKTDGFFSLYLRDMASLKELFAQAKPEKSKGAFDFASVMYQPDADKPLSWKKRETALPWITGGQRPVFADGEEALRLFFATNFVPQQTVILPESCRGSVTATNSARIRISATSFANNEVVVNANASGPTFVVVGQAFHPNWQAFVDGRPAQLLKANFAFEAVEIPAGKHQVRLVYQDKAFGRGGLISVAGLLICGLLWFMPRRGSLPKKSAAPVTP